MSPEVRSLAELLYVDLVGRVMFPTGAASTATKPNPENLAKMCIKLAEAFDKAQAQELLDAAPKAAKYDVQLSDISGWEKK
jgi:hypothetical protein